MNKLVSELHFAFNIWDFESARSVIDAAASVHQDVILQTSTGIFNVISTRLLSNFVHSYAEYKGIHAWLNLDHCRDKNILRSAVDDGWDMIMADGSSLPIDQNIDFVNEILIYAHERGTLVEAEVGQVKGIEDDVIVQKDAIASQEEIAIFLKETDIDFIAVAFGNAHGKYIVKPNLHYNLVEFTTSITDKPFVVHGGSGLSDEILSRLIKISGVKKINISTDLKMAYKRGIELSLQSWTQPINASDIIHDEIMKVAISKMKLIV